MLVYANAKHLDVQLFAEKFTDQSVAVFANKNRYLYERLLYYLHFFSMLRSRQSQIHVVS